MMDISMGFLLLFFFWCRMYVQCYDLEINIKEVSNQILSIHKQLSSNSINMDA